jgi:hypothetical protein
MHEVYFEKKAVLGVGGDFPFTDLIYPRAVKDLWQSGDIKEIAVDAAYFAANFDGTGLGINSRKGWAWCNGQNLTPDLRGKVTVNHHDGDGDFGLQDTGGEKTHTLTVLEMPAHQHSYLKPTLVSNSDAGGTADFIGAANDLTGVQGAGDPHNNLQPYYTVLKIMKL